MLLDYENKENEAQEESDESILRASVKDPALFEMLVDRYEAALVGKAMKVLGGREDAEDAVQETFTKIYLNAGRFKEVPGATFKSWAYKILLNTCFSHYRRQKRRNELTFNLPPELIGILPDKSDVREEKDMRDYVASLLTRVPKKMADVLRMHYLLGKPQKEIAAENGISVGAVKTQIYRAKKEFRRVNADALKG